MATRKVGNGNDGPREIPIQMIDEERIVVHILGTSPLIMNRMASKAKHELLFPGGRNRRKESSPKHDPWEEFHESAYKSRDSKDATLLTYPASAFKRACIDASPDIPTVAGSEIRRLLWVWGDSEGTHGFRDRVCIYGAPQLMMAVVRNSGYNAAPDIRTRVVLPAWCCKIEVAYERPYFNPTTIANLMVIIGRRMGLGDWRLGKGGLFGRFIIVMSNNKTYRQIIKTGGRAAQTKAMNNPSFFDQDTTDLYNWFYKEVSRRGTEGLRMPKKHKRDKESGR